MSLSRHRSQSKLSQLSLGQNASSHNLKGRLRIVSMNTSPIHSKKDLPGFLPSIISTNHTLPPSTKSKKSASIDESIMTSLNTISHNTEPARMKKKSQSAFNIHDQSSILATEQNSIINEKVKIGQKKPISHKKNLSYANTSNASTLNISQNNSKQDFSLMLNDIQSANMIKNVINNSYLSTNPQKSLNSSRIIANNNQRKTEDQNPNIDIELQKLMNIYNNNTVTNTPKVGTTNKITVQSNQDTITFEEDQLFANQLQTDPVNENNSPPKSQQHKREKQHLQLLQQRIKEMDSLHLEYKMLLTEIMNDTKKDNLFNILNSIIELCEKYCNNPEFTIKNYNLYAEICRDIGDFNKSIQLLHHARLISSMSAKYHIKLEMYKKVSDILSQSGQSYKALVYLKKMLRLAWKLRDEDTEIEAYDLIGKVLMLIGEVDLSDFFHQKSMNNEKEPINSPLRISGEIGVKIKLGNQQTNDAHDYHSDSDDDLDLTSFPKSKQDENVTRNETLQQKKQQYFSLPKILTNFGKRYQSLGRLNIPSYLRDELEIKVSQRLSHLSQNRDLKNFYVYTYKNQNFWIKNGDYNQQQKFYILKKNYSKHRSHINRIVKDLKSLQYNCLNEIKSHIEIDNNKILNSDLLY